MPFCAPKFVVTQLNHEILAASVSLRTASNGLQARLISNSASGAIVVPKDWLDDNAWTNSIGVCVVAVHSENETLLVGHQYAKHPDTNEAQSPDNIEIKPCF